MAQCKTPHVVVECPIHQHKNCRLDAPNARGTWPPTNMHTNANQQCNGTCATHQKIIIKSTQGHGYVLPLAKMPQCTGPILLLLETWHTELGRLLHQASPNQPPQIYPSHNPNVRQWSQIHKTLQENNNNRKFWTKNQNIGVHKIFCQESTTNTKVQDHDADLFSWW